MMQPPWLYDESRQVGTDYADPANVAAYDTQWQAVRNIDQEIEVVARSLNLSSSGTVWEIGCGTGEMSIGLATRCRHVYASDISTAMLTLARRKATDNGIRNVTFEPGGFLSGFAPPEPVHGVVSQLVLHHLPDLWKLPALQRIAHRLQPNGRLFLRDVIYPSGVPDYNAYFAGLIAAIRREGGDTLARETIVHIREEHSTFAWIIEEMLRQAGFSVAEKMAERFTTVYICIKQHR